MVDGSDIILDDVKKLLNVGTDIHEFDADIQAHINGAFFTLFHLGIGPTETPFYISDDTEWHNLETTVPYDVILDYLHLKVAIIFDPPASSAVMEAYKNRIAELEFYMSILVDNGGGIVVG